MGHALRRSQAKTVAVHGLSTGLVLRSAQAKKKTTTTTTTTTAVDGPTAAGNAVGERSRAKTAAVGGPIAGNVTAAVVRRRGRPKKTDGIDNKVTMKKPYSIEFTIIKSGYNGLIPLKILGITQKFSQLMFVVQMKNIKKPVLVEASYMNLEYHVMVIQYYESIIEWQKKK